MANGIFDSALSRKLVQIRFRPTLKWLNARATSSGMLESKYQEWRTDENGNVSLFSPDNKKALEVFTDQTTYINEDNTVTPDEGINHIVTIMENAMDTCGVKELRRIGYRETIIFKSTIKFDEIVDLLDKKLFSQSKDIKALQGSKIHDSSFVIETSHDNFINHIQIGATNKAQALSLFAPKFKLSKDFENENNLFVDIDSSISAKLDRANFEEYLNKTIGLTLNTSSGYIKYLSKG